MVAKISRKPLVVILAAGRGTRIRSECHSIPKCMLQVNGKPIIEHIIDSCNLAGLDDIVVVVGFRANAIRAALGKRVRYVHNPRFMTTQTLHSFYCTRRYGIGRTIYVIDGDNYFEPTLIRRLVRDKHPNALILDYNAKLDPEATKVRVEGDRVLEVEKTIRGQAEITGLLKMSPKLAGIMYRRAAEAAHGSPCHPHLTSAMNEIYATQRVHAIPLDRSFWVEIDFPSDLCRAQTLHLADKTRSRIKGAFSRFIKALK